MPHGEANAILLPHTMRYTLAACAARQRLIADAMGVATPRMSDAEAGRAAADAVDALCRALALPRTLREVDVPEEGLAAIAAATLHDRSLRTNPKPIADAGPIMAVLRAAYYPVTGGELSEGVTLLAFPMVEGKNGRDDGAVRTMRGRLEQHGRRGAHDPGELCSCASEGY